jgi:putative membrane protein insertion efficiency factor
MSYISYYYKPLTNSTEKLQDMKNFQEQIGLIKNILKRIFKAKSLAVAGVFLTKKLIILPIKIYQLFISPWLGFNCRFQPTCSQYTIEAIEKKGLIKGLFLGIIRISKCHPFSKKSGFDPLK